MRYLIVLVVVLAGCWPNRVDVPTGSTCAGKATCGQCAALAPCAWCASSNGTLRGCFAKGHRSDCDGPVVDVVEACPEDATGRQ